MLYFPRGFAGRALSWTNRHHTSASSLISTMSMEPSAASASAPASRGGTRRGHSHGKRNDGRAFSSPRDGGRRQGEGRSDKTGMNARGHHVRIFFVFVTSLDLQKSISISLVHNSC
jgi:hypothetical protein